MNIPIKLLDDTVTTPQYSLEGSGCFDIFAHENIVIPPYSTKKVATGFCVEVPYGHVMKMHSRSSMALRGLVVANDSAIIDHGYSGEVGVLLYNRTHIGTHVKRGERIAQGEVCETLPVHFVPVDELEPSVRGNGGFGSTGK